ncbi:MAG TPA: hypothetical protein VK154_01900 [Chitinophagales bacterium]|nr:hypothetical protein [Chitinophagales bacterium]
MKSYFTHLIDRIQSYSKEIKNTNSFIDKRWILIDNKDGPLNTYIFRKNNELLISKHGIVDTSKWEYLGENTLLIERKNSKYLFKHGFIDEDVFLLKLDGLEEYWYLISEKLHNQNILSSDKVAEYLNNKYSAKDNSNTDDESSTQYELIIVLTLSVILFAFLFFLKR